MAVRALPRPRTGLLKGHDTVAVPPTALAVTLIAPVLDLLATVQPAGLISQAATAAAALAMVVLAACWLRFPRTNWLAAASFAAGAGLLLRLLGAEVAPLLSLLAIIALGIGGAFATRDQRDLSLLDA